MQVELRAAIQDKIYYHDMIKLFFLKKKTRFISNNLYVTTDKNRQIYVNYAVVSE